MNVQELTNSEIEEVNGGLFANIVGAVAGAIGGVYGAAIAGGGGASAGSLWGAGFAGAATGFVNPVSGVGRFAGTIGTGLLGGAVTNAYKSTTNDFQSTTDE